MPSYVIGLVVFIIGLDMIIVCLPFILRRRGVYLWWRTMFGPAIVLDSQDGDGTRVRLLNVRSKYQSVGYVDKNLRWELACIYHKYFAQIVEIAGLATQTDSGPHDDFVAAHSAVVIGGGGYSFPKWLVAHGPTLRTTVVEIDPKITEIAREHFFVDDLIAAYDCERTGQLELVNADGWAWLRDCGRTFDLVVNDAFSGKKPLGPLGTREGARLIHERLTPEGLYLANVIAPLEGKGSQHLHEVSEAFCSEFSHVWLIPEAEDEPRVTADNVLVASDRPLDIARRYQLKTPDALA